MLVSKYIYKYLCEQCEKFKNIPIDNHNVIYKRHLKTIDEDEEMKTIFYNVCNNLQEINEMAKKKYIKKYDDNFKQNEKRKANEYSNKYYHTNENYRNKRKEKYEQNKEIISKIRKQKYEEKKKMIEKLKQDNDKLKNVINNINENILSVSQNNI
jgi:hypothetical protein